MATFYVGQRVRMVKSDNHLANDRVGHETRISCEWRHVLDGEHWEMEDGWSVPKKRAGDFYEPIIPEGHKASEYTYTELMDRLRSGVTA